MSNEPIPNSGEFWTSAFTRNEPGPGPGPGCLDHSKNLLTSVLQIILKMEMSQAIRSAGYALILSTPAYEDLRTEKWYHSTYHCGMFDRSYLGVVEAVKTEITLELRKRNPNYVKYLEVSVDTTNENLSEFRVKISMCMDVSTCENNTSSDENRISPPLEEGVSKLTLSQRESHGDEKGINKME